MLKGEKCEDQPIEIIRPFPGHTVFNRWIEGGGVRKKKSPRLPLSFFSCGTLISQMNEERSQSLFASPIPNSTDWPNEIGSKTGGNDSLLPVLCF